MQLKQSHDTSGPMAAFGFPGAKVTILRDMDGIPSFPYQE